VRTPTADIATDFWSGPWVKLFTNVITCDPRKSPDLTLECTITNATSVLVYKSVPRVSGNWTVDAKVFLQVGAEPVPYPNESWWMAFEILDNIGKVIFTIHNWSDIYSGTQGCSVNGTDWVTPISTDIKWRSTVEREVPLIVAANVGTGTMSITYAGITASRTVFEVGASLTNPARVQLKFRPAPTGVYAYGACSITKLRYTEP